MLGVSAEGQLGALLRGELEGTLDVRSTPEGFIGALRPYQERGVAWLKMLERLGLGACLADDMGLGKTATVLALLQEEHLSNLQDNGRSKGRKAARGPTLVICPTSVAGNWARESARSCRSSRCDAPWRHPVPGSGFRRSWPARRTW